MRLICRSCSCRITQRRLAASDWGKRTTKSMKLDLTLFSRALDPARSKIKCLIAPHAKWLPSRRRNTSVGAPSVEIQYAKSVSARRDLTRKPLSIAVAIVSAAISANCAIAGFWSARCSWSPNLKPPRKITSNVS